MKKQIQDSMYTFPYHYLDIKTIETNPLSVSENEALIKTIKELLGDINGKKLLDAGSGDGRLLHELQSNRVTLAGVDYSEKALRFARAFNPSITFFWKNLVDMDLAKNYDYITFIETLEHIEPFLIPKALKNLHRHLKNNGKLIVSVPSTNIPVLKKHYQHFTPSSLIKTLSPWFKVKKMIPFSKQSIDRRLMSYWGLYGSRAHGFLIQKYYNRFLKDANFNNCRKLVAVCEKWKKN